MAEAASIRGAGRDIGEVCARLEAWFAQRLPGCEPVVGGVEIPEANGMSSETLLFDVELTEDDTRARRRCVARVAPGVDTVPVFPRYDLDAQYRVMRIVGDRTAVPVPTARWNEPDPAWLGSPFFVMDRIDGIVPPDVMPYNFGSWLMEASLDDQRRLQDATVAAIAGIHAITPDDVDLSFLASDEPGDSPLAQHVAGSRSFHRWAMGDIEQPLIDRCFDWLQANWPADEGPTVLNWGDARVGNVLFRDYEPVAVLDWEMAALGPREVDVGWCIFLHAFFEDIATSAGLPGMPHFMRPEDVAATYEQASGVAPRNLEFHLMYAALRHGIVMSRIHLRMVHLGEAEVPPDADDMILHRATLEAMLEHRYWPARGVQVG